MSAHSHFKVWRVANYVYLMPLQLFNHARGIFSRMLIGTTNGPINYSGMFMWVWMTRMLISRIQHERPRDQINMNNFDKPEFWFGRYSMMFPPGLLQNRVSAHYLEITHIYTIEMFKRYQLARKEIIDERERHSDQVKRTRYVLNPNYIYEPFGSPDAPQIAACKASGTF